MKRSNRKGFTTVELVIVIAVIAILAAVMIPTFVSLIKKAEESAYLQEKTNQMILDMQEEVLNKDYMTWEEFETELQKLLDEKLAGVNTGLTEDQVREIINAALSKLNTNTNGLTKAQVEKIIKNALKDLDVSGLTKEEVEAIIKDLLENWTPSNPTEPEQPTEPQPTEPAATEVGSVEELLAAIANGGNIKLTSSLTITDIITVDKDTSLDINNNIITFYGDNGLFDVTAGTFELKNGTVAASCGDCNVISVANAELNLSDVDVFVSAKSEGGYVTAISVSGTSTVELNDTDVSMPGTSAQVGNVSYSGQYSAIELASNATNSSIVVNGGNYNLSGTGSISFIYGNSKSGASATNTIHVNNSNISLDQQGDDGWAIVFEVKNTVSQVAVVGSNISLSADTADQAALNYRNSATKSATGFTGAFAYTDCNITIDNVENLEDSSYSDFGGTCTITGGTCTGYDFASWTATGFTYIP